MQDGPFGMMVHYLKGIFPKNGEPNPDFSQAVNHFDVQRFADDVANTGARWLIFTFGQNPGFYVSPNSYLESLISGCCSQRDLVAEIADAMHARGLKFIAYLPAEIDLQSEALRQALGWEDDDPTKAVFQARYMKMIQCWSEQHGDRIDGWFFDGCYVAKEKGFMRTHNWDNSRFDADAWAAAIRAGNPNAVFTMNGGVGYLHHILDNQNFVSGEFNDLSFLPDGPTSFGMQNQVLTWIDCFWMHNQEPGEMPPPRYTDEALFAFVAHHRRVGSAVTLNVGIYEDGTLAPRTLEQLTRLSDHLAQHGVS